MKDHFSAGAGEYARFRPAYPEELYGFLMANVHARRRAWDCGTGNGQVACTLAACFDEVYATDISLQQLENAPKRENIVYKRESAEKTGFPDNYFDLVTVAQAIHWFDFHRFYREVQRTLQPGGLLAVIGYGLIRSLPGEKINTLIDQFYTNILGPYWDRERKYIDENYRTLPFPFHEIETPSLIMKYSWTAEHFTGYLDTWSAVKHYTRENGTNPVDIIRPELLQLWGENPQREFQFPVLLRVGRVEKEAEY